MDIIKTCMIGKNEDLIPQVLQLYAKAGMRIADVTYGRGNFWKKVDISQYEFFPSDIQSGIDLRSLPYEDHYLDMLVLDPPYMHGSKTPILAGYDATYQNNARDSHGGHNVMELYRKGIFEADRVLKKNGILLVKCIDQIESGKQWFDHITIFSYARTLGMIAEDLFILMRETVMMRHSYQIHARKNHSYLWVFRKVRDD